MKRIIGLVVIGVILLFCPCLICAQSEPVPVSGTNILRKQDFRTLQEAQISADQQIAADIINNGDTVGDSASFWSYNFKTYSYEEIAANCRAVIDLETGYRLNMWVEDGQIVSDSVIADIQNQYINVILPNESDCFGSPPGGDFTILILDIRDNFPSTNTYYAGYFNPLNEYPNLSYSNGRHMIFLDGYPGIPGSTNFYGILAHEFQHFIHFNKDPYEETWVDEGLASLARFVCGYGHPAYHINSFGQAPSTSLILWGNSSADYGASYLFILYLYERYGRLPIRNMVSDPAVGIEGINNALAPFGTNMEAMFKKWVIANYLNDASISGGVYGYTHSFAGIPYAPGNILISRIESTYPTFGGGLVSPFAAHYSRFVNLGDSDDTFVAVLYSVDSVYDKSYVYTARQGSLLLNISGLDNTLKAQGIHQNSSNPSLQIIDLSEANSIELESQTGSTGDGGGGGGCFITTAAFDSFLSDIITALRSFRHRSSI